MKVLIRKLIDYITGFLNKNKPCECGRNQCKLISTTKNGKYKGKLPICEFCYFDLLKD